MTAAPKNAKSFPQDRVVPLVDLEIEDGFNSSKLVPVDDLAASIAEVGLENPIHVRHLENSELLFVIDGHRRFEAAKKVGLSKVKVIDHGYLDTPKAKLVAYRQNILRRKVTKKELMDTVRCLDKAEYSGADIAKQMGLAKSTVSEYITLARASPKLRKAAAKPVSEGGITTKTALQAAKTLTKPQQQRAVPKIAGKTTRQAEHILPLAPVGGPGVGRPGVLMAGEKLSPTYRLISDYKERCQEMEIAVTKLLRQTPSNQKLQGIELMIGVLRGKLTVKEALTNWQKV